MAFIDQILEIQEEDSTLGHLRELAVREACEIPQLLERLIEAAWEASEIKLRRRKLLQQINELEAELGAKHEELTALRNAANEQVRTNA